MRYKPPYRPVVKSKVYLTFQAREQLIEILDQYKKKADAFVYQELKSKLHSSLHSLSLDQDFGLQFFNLRYIIVLESITLIYKKSVDAVYIILFWENTLPIS